MKRELKGNLMLLLASFLWGTTFVAQSVGADYVSPFAYLASRSVIGALVLIPVILFFDAQKKKEGVYRKLGRKENKELIFGGIVCGVVLTVASALQQIGMSIDASAGDAGFITALYILIVPIFQLFFGKKTGWKTWVGILLALVGLYFLTEKFNGFTPGCLFVFLSAVAFSVHILVVDHFVATNDGVRLSCIQFSTVAVISAIVMFLTHQTPSAENFWNARYAILYAGVLSSGVAYTLQIVGQSYTNPTTAALMMSPESVFALLSGMIVQPEQNPVKALKLFGCALIFTAIILAQLPQRRKAHD